LEKAKPQGGQDASSGLRVRGEGWVHRGLGNYGADSGLVTKIHRTVHQKEKWQF
jgi:hypothetical protein